MIKPSIKQIGIAAGLAALAGALIVTHGRSDAGVPAQAGGKGANTAGKERATLTVMTVQPTTEDWSMQLAANGNVMAWQEAVVGSELGGLRLAEVMVNVGDVVVRGQTLARFATESVAAELAQQEAAEEEAQAAVAEAVANADRARVLGPSGMLSKQQVIQLLTVERSAKARLRSVQARTQSERIRLRQTQVVAPDDGIISARNATVGAVAAQGAELFRLMRRGRLEWRAEVAPAELARIKLGQTARVTAGDGREVRGTVRSLAPIANGTTRNTLVYVDLPPGNALQAGTYATGQFDLGHSTALTVPQSAIVTRDGYDYVFQVAADSKVKQVRVAAGRRNAKRVEILNGLLPAMPLVDQGAGFLADGDLVNVVRSASELARN